MPEDGTKKNAERKKRKKEGRKKKERRKMKKDRKKMWGGVNLACPLRVSSTFLNRYASEDGRRRKEKERRKLERRGWAAFGGTAIGVALAHFLHLV